MWQVINADGDTLALACMTAPKADKIVGYAGPNNVLLIMDAQGRVTQTHWLDALDTRDHVERVRADERFWQQFTGRLLGSADHKPIDGVSGATLTSLAIAESIDLRLSGSRPNLRFPNSITLEEVQGLLPTAVKLVNDARHENVVDAHDASGAIIGRVLRTGPLSDDKIGYQGPLELLVALDRDDRIIKVKVRSSYDNEPYIRYTRMEASFWAKFVGRTLHEISQVNLEAEGIEGVSGATMTSMAAADTLIAAARKHYALLLTEPESAVARAWNWSLGEVTTALLAVLLVPWSLSRLRGRRAWRRAWRVLALLVIVVLSGNLISMALLAGWTRSLPAFTLAPGLSLLVAVSLAMPILFGRNVYCDHVCPHGMVQQGLVQLSKGRKRLGARARLTGWKPVLLARVLKSSAFGVLLLSMGWILWTAPDQLTFFEPFDVYAWRIGWSVSLIVWVASLLLASRVPMGYCRLACPTGMLLESIRRTRAGRRWQNADMLWLALTAAVWLAVAVS